MFPSPFRIPNRPNCLRTRTARGARGVRARPRINLPAPPLDIPHLVETLPAGVSAERATCSSKTAPTTSAACENVIAACSFRPGQPFTTTGRVGASTRPFRFRQSYSGASG
jgi:hypothetical protein